VNKDSISRADNAVKIVSKTALAARRATIGRPG
jgi:hypothetical protein